MTTKPSANLTPSEIFSLTHWIHYGQPGTPSENRILAPDWETEPFTHPVTTPWSLPVPLTAAQVLNLVNGFKPREMEDKWFIYSSGPDEEGKLSVHFFRSWTGYEYAQIEIQLAKEGGGGEVTALVWESDAERVSDQDFEGTKEVVVRVCKWVLDVELPVSV